MKKILVTGGAGFIGSHLCEELLSRGHTVTAFDNLFSGSKENCKTFINNKRFNLVVGDVRDKEHVFQVVEKVDMIYHLAAIVGVSVVVAQPLQNIEVNMEGTKNVAEAALAKGKKKILFTSSSEVYGKNGKVPLSEDESDSVFGTTKVSRWAYGMAKGLSEHLLLGYADKGLPVSIVRYFNCYGPRGINPNYSNVIPNFISLALANKPLTIHGDGSQTRCFCNVHDTVRGTILAAENISNDIVNVGSANEITILGLAESIIKLTKSKSKIIFVDEATVFKRKYESSTKRVPDMSKAERLLKFLPQVDLTTGLLETIAWTKERMPSKIGTNNA